MPDFFAIRRFDREQPQKAECGLDLEYKKVARLMVSRHK